MMMSVEQLVEWELSGETEVLGEYLPQFHFSRLKSHMTWRGIEIGPLRWETGGKLTAWAKALHIYGCYCFVFLPLELPLPGSK
jgi:hypothetical protein